MATTLAGSDLNLRPLTAPRAVDVQMCLLLAPIACPRLGDIANRQHNGIAATRNAIAAPGVTTDGKRLKRPVLPRSREHLKDRPPFRGVVHHAPVNRGAGYPVQGIV